MFSRVGEVTEDLEPVKIWMEEQEELKEQLRQNRENQTTLQDKYEVGLVGKEVWRV